MKEGEAMQNGTVGVAEDEQAPSDAIEWYVSNASDQELDPKLVLRWEGWCNGPGHLEEYAFVVELHRELRSLPAPVEAGQAALLRDVDRETEVRGTPDGAQRH